MPAANNTVQLVINVVDANSGQVISTVTKNIDSLGAAGQRFGNAVADGMGAAGAAGARAGKQVGDGFKEMGGHALTTLDNVRLVRDVFGLHLPRSIEKAIASSKTLSTVIGGIGGALIGLGGVEIAFHTGREIYDFFNKLQDVNAEMRKYAAQANQNATQKLFDTQSIEEVNALLKQTNGLMAGLDQKRVNAGVGVDNSGSLKQFFNRAFTVIGASELGQVAPPDASYTKDDDKQRAQLAAQNDLLNERRKAVDAKRAVDQQEAKARADGARLVGDAADAAAARNAKDLARLKQQQAQAEAVYQRDAISNANSLIRQQNPGKSDNDLRDKGLQPVPVVAPDLGTQDRADAEANADLELGAKRTARARKENDELAALRDQAHAAGLQGEAKYQAELQATIDGFKRRQIDGELSNAGRFIAIAQDRYNKERALRVQSEREETARIQAEAAGAGQTGLARIDAERRASMAKLDRQRGTFSDSSTYGQRRDAKNTGFDSDQAKAEGDFTDRVRRLEEDRANASMTANQRILLDAQRTIEELKKAWQDLYGGLAATDPRRVQSMAALNAGIASVNTGAGIDVQRNNRSIADETAKLQLEAGRGGGGNTFAERSQGIQAEAQDRLRQIEEREKAASDAGELDNVRQFELQKQAIQQAANNKELDLMREQRDKLAGELQGLFSNPIEWLKKQGSEIAGKSAADLLQGRLPGRGDVQGTGIFDAILSGRGGGNGTGGFRDAVRPTFGGKPRLPGMHGDASHAEMSSLATSQAVVNAGSAVINLGAASFSGGASGSGGRYVPTGNGGYFNIGGGGSSGPASEAGSPASIAASGGGVTGIGGGAGDGDFSGGGLASVQSAIGTAQGVYSGGKDLAQQLGLFGGKSSGSGVTGIGGGDGDGDFTQGGLASVGGGTAGSGASLLGQLGGAAGGVLGVYSAFEGKGGVSGAFQGALSGAKVGAEFGGPLGAAIGGIIGGVAGFIGHGARVEAQKYWFKELQPKLLAEQLAFNQGSAAYQSVYDDYTSSDLEAKNRTRQMGSGAVGYYNDRIHPAIQQMTQQLTREARAGRQQFGISAAQSHNGGLLDSFGSMATGDDEGWVHAQRGQILLNQRAATTGADVASMLNAGVARSDIGQYLGGGGNTRVAADTGGETHLHVHTMDVKGVRDFLAAYKHDIRGAVNQSYAENSGGAD